MSLVKSRRRISQLQERVEILMNERRKNRLLDEELRAHSELVMQLTREMKSAANRKTEEPDA